MEDYCREVLKTLLEPIENDPIKKCGRDALSKITSKPDEAIEIARENLNVFPFKDVDSCWRRLYTDAHIAKAALTVVKGTRKHSDHGDFDWLDDAVEMLDMALIVAGAPLREEMIEEMFSKLQTRRRRISTQGQAVQDR